MHRPFFAAWLAAGLTSLASPAWSQGQLDWLQAGATQVSAGSSVGFGVGWSIQGEFQSGGGNNPVEPAAVEGSNEWLMNWYWTESTTALGIEVQVSGPQLLSFSEQPPSGPAGSFGFQMQFDAPGSYLVSASGSFALRRTRVDEAELATRYCYNSGDPEQGVYLVCDSWGYSYPRLQTESDLGGALNTLSVQIEVQAVPEPATVALWLGGLAALGLGACRRRDQAAGSVSPRTGTRGASAHISS
ncbi:PEP-CTERM sorting domain-containing protein [Aquabacterium sp. OR-4]|uniref:PEP-CTERM sorting domain-containing protein n=1 Tax=Aquabacterium sp. OR-4 TaxID=2978127 RepID=UPI0021B339F0|nr:PEP-CTERM sorting domain-containing protein [Aquabacterium sp. OR-4]MDT7833593.1 PEP-CTERM sorting domain-containing protein [Aquabacterium sp. OR-4]